MNANVANTTAVVTGNTNSVATDEIAILPSQDEEIQINSVRAFLESKAHRYPSYFKVNAAVSANLLTLNHSILNFDSLKMCPLFLPYLPVALL